METVRLVSLILQIYCPTKSSQVLDALNIDPKARSISNIKIDDKATYFSAETNFKSLLKEIRVTKVE